MKHIPTGREENSLAKRPIQASAPRPREPTMRTQFDLSHITVDDSLQGVRLASFRRRAIAYLLDWALIGLSAELFWPAVALALVYLLVRKRVSATVSIGAGFLNKGFQTVDQKLSEFDISSVSRRHFAVALRLYIYFVICAPLLLSCAIVVRLVLGVLLPDRFGSVDEQVVTIQHFFESVEDMYHTALKILGGAIGGIMYFSLFSWKWEGQTPGKRLMRIRVAKLNGRRITLWNSFERVSGYAASASLLLLGFFQYFWDKNHQTTHDKISETIVIRL